MSALTVRRYEPSDGDAVRALHRTRLPEAPAAVPDDPPPDLADVSGRYLDADAEFLVGTVDDVVGTAAYAPVSTATREQFAGLDPAVREVMRVLVHPDHRRRGFGSAIYDRIEARARSEGVPRFVCTTGVENSPARAFFEAQGFEGVREPSVEIEGTPLHLAVYRKDLAG